MIATAHAQSAAAAEAANFVAIFNNVIMIPLIALLGGIAFLVFLWGCFEYVTNANNSTGREQGARHITFGIIGLVVMVSAFAILSIVAATFSLDGDLNAARQGNPNITLPAPITPTP